tara:strand:+ start:842 stop:1384 length:543 start_codon:yes stop_codon:yes gene_type:complete
MVLNFISEEENLFPHSKQLGEGLRKANPDVIQGVMYAKGIGSSTEQDDINTSFADLTGMTDTFTIEKEGKALVIFSAEYIPLDDLHDFGSRCRVVLDGTPVPYSERGDATTAYADDGMAGLDVKYAGVAAGVMSSSTMAIIDLDAGTHTIKIQGRSVTGTDCSFKTRRMDIIVWSAPVQQ